MSVFNLPIQVAGQRTRGLHRFPLQVLAALCAVPLLSSCHGAPPASPAGQGSISLSSPFLSNGQVDRSITCDGANISPTLAWSAPPPATRALTLLVTDPDAPGGTFTHWVLYNLPAVSQSLPSGVAKQPQLPDGSRQGRNDFGETGYGGPCPPGHSPHRYIFTLYALDKVLDLPPGATRQQVEDELHGHILARGQLTARYGR